MSQQRIETICVQGGYTPGNGEPRQIPIIQSTTFKYATSEDMGKLFDLEASGYFYTRLQNPTNDHVAAKIAALEGGTAAMLTSSGQAANFFALFNIATCGDHIVASSSIYGGTFNLISVTMAKMGITCTFVAPDCTAEELDAAFRPNTRAVFGETIANPALTVLDIEKFAAAAHAHGVPLIVDNTFATPVNCRPFEWGADIVTHSTTKYMDGHGTAVGGAIVDGGRFDWMAHADKFPGLCTPDESYHGITYAERFGKEGAFITKCTAQLMRDLGAIQSPQHAFYLNLGLESLHVRMARHCENGQAVAEYLSAHPKVERVIYCGLPLPGDPYHALAQKYLPNAPAAWYPLSSRADVRRQRLYEGAQLAAIETHVADARTLLPQPRQLHPSPDERRAAARGRRTGRPGAHELRPGEPGGPDCRYLPGVGTPSDRRNAIISQSEANPVPIKIPNQLPATETLTRENIFVMTETRALTQDIRPLRILLLNLMPTKVDTETQFARVLGNTPLQIELELIAPSGRVAKNTPQEHMLAFYKRFCDVKDQKFDGLLITGAPVEHLPFEQVDYWPELCEIMEWSKTHVHSTLHICWGAQAGLYYHYGIPKRQLPHKLFGVFEHTVEDPNFILFRGFDDRFGCLIPEHHRRSCGYRGCAPASRSWPPRRKRVCTP